MPFPSGSMAGSRRARAPHVNENEQEQPDDVDEVPVPGRRLEPEMMVRLEMPEVGADQANGQEDRADDDVRTMEAGRHEEGRTVDVAAVGERGVRVFVSLHARERDAENDRQPEALDQPLAVVLQ